MGFIHLSLATKDHALLSELAPLWLSLVDDLVALTS